MIAQAEMAYHARPDLRVVVADGDPSVRSALRLVLNQAAGLHSIREAADMDELLLALASTPDLVLLDWNLPGTRGEDLIAALRTCAPKAAVVIVSTRPEPRSLALTAGAAAFVCKSDDPVHLMATLRRLVRRVPSVIQLERFKDQRLEVDSESREAAPSTTSRK